MTVPPDDTTTDLHAVIAELRKEREALAEALARRNSEYGERIEQQAATIDVLRAMSSSPGDAEPVFNLMVERARAFCGADNATAAMLDGDMLRLMAQSGMNGEAGRIYAAQFPRPISTDSMFGRSILKREAVHVQDVWADPNHYAHGGVLSESRAVISVPLLRGGIPIGAMTLGRRVPGKFSVIQVELLQTLAEQAVIAITSAETYRALEERTATLATRNSEYGERIEHQAATIDVLKAMSASPGDPQPVFDLIVDRARDICGAYGATVFEFDGTGIHWRAATGVSDDPAVRAAYEAQFPMVPTRGWAFGRAILDRRIIRIDDMEAEPGLDPTLRGITAKSNVTIPIMRGDEVIGVIGMGSREKGGFSDSQVELLKTFAEQAAIAITSAETYRALQTRTSDLQETLEYQTAISDVLKVISRSAFDLQPVLETLLKTAARLCDADTAGISSREGDTYRVVASFSNTPAFDTFIRGQSFTASRASVTGRTVVEGHIVHIADLAADPEYAVTEAVTLGGVRTGLGVPLLREGEVAGVIILGRFRMEPFTDRQIELVSTFADQAVIAIENTRLITEQREALEQQTATAEVLQVINASPGNLAPVFDAMLDRAMRLCDGAQGTLWMFDGERMCASATAGYTSKLAKQLSEWREIHPFQRRLSQGERVFQIVDLAAEELYHSGNPLTRAAVDVAGIRTVVFVALVKDASTLGGFTIGRREVRAFTDKDIALLQNFAEQAVIAIENTRLMTEQREALEQQTATAEVLEVINSSPGDLGPVFQALLRKAHTLCEASFGALMTYDGERFHALAHQGTPAPFREFLGSGLLPGPGDPFGLMVEGAAYSHIHDLLEVVARYPGEPLPRAAADLGGIRTLLVVPLRKDSELLGVITAYRQETRPFSDRQIALLQNFAAQAVIAMENARLLTETREALEQQTATAEVLQVINASPGELTPVFDAILEKAHTLCGFAHGTLSVFDGTHFYTVATYDIPEAFAEVLRRQRISGPQAPLLRGDRIIHIPDFQAMEATSDDPVSRAAIEAGIRTVLFVALRNERGLLGYLTADRMEVRPFSEKEIGVMESFAAQAVIAMENARLINELREALEQQTATAEVLQVINASPGNLTPVFDAMLERALRLCGATIGGIYGYSGQRFDTVALFGVTPAFREYNDKYPMREVRPGSSPARMIETRGPVQNPDVLASETYRAGSPYARALAELGGIRAVLNVPLLKEGALVGFIAIYREQTGTFSDKQIALLEGFAAQAVIAMENARLINEQREALEQQTATAKVLQVINRSRGDLVPVFDAILESAHSLCDIARGSLELYDGVRFHAVAVRGLSTPLADTLRQGYPASDNPATRQLIEGGRLSHIRDLAETDYAITRRAVETDAARTLLCVPLRRDETLLGMIASARDEVRPFSEKEIVLLENFAAQAVIAMENARLINEQREALEQQTATAEVLQVINASPGDLVPVFDAMLEKALDLCGAAFGVLWTFDGEQIHAVAHRGVGLEFAEYLTRTPHPVGPDNAHGRLLAGESVVHIVDAKGDKAYQSGDPLRRILVELGGGRTLLAVPLRKDETFLGDFVIYRLEVRPFSDKQIALLENFAAQAVIAMENARLLDEIRQRQDELRVTFENMGDGVAMFDETQYLAAWNRKFQDILDLPDALLGQHRTYEEHLLFLAGRGDFGPGIDTVEQINELVASTGQPYGYERTRPDGRVIEIRRNPVPDGGFVLIYSDITERKRSEEEVRAARDAAETALRELKIAQANLIQAEKMASLGQLTAGIAHEIKNPLNFVNNFAALSVDLLGELKETAAPGFAALTDDQRAEVEDVSAMLTSNLEKITEHGKRADGIVKAMLEHSRGSSGERRMVDLNALIDEALNLAYHGARAQDQSFNVTLERDFGEGISPIEVNPQDITRVFLNLFANAFYATTRRAREGGDAGFEPTLTVTTRDAGEAVEIRVRDNGTGIQADIRDKLFQPFFTTKPTGEGTGLGLSITYDIVTKAHGGSIAVDSKVGDYSEFTIRLPRSL